jgi:hypothetical protein
MLSQQYRWHTPQEWLLDKIEAMEREPLLQMLRPLIRQLDSDTIQDLYQYDMDLDGYFEPQAE